MLQVKIDNIYLNSTNSTREIISNTKFELAENKIYTILGKNGSGKSTLIKSITRLLNENNYKISGSVIFNGKNIYDCPQNELLKFRKEKIKYVFQDAVNSFDHLKTLKYYFKLLAKNSDETDELLKYFLLPNSDNLFKMYPYEISGGMSQRVSFVLALLSHPEIIILDEPTSGIDSAIANLFLLKLKEFVKKNKNSSLLVTQDISFAEKISDRIAYLSNGKLSDFRSVDDFLNDPGNPLLEKFLLANNKIEYE
ncbi:MAG TPA: ATP-binding cassette domain-containing protein [Ignavibacteriaceae bacterium]|nr:ATP-binding cassette domain-containing protein [Ignavibacteriaceae bacterium]